MIVTIETERLIIRPVAPSDAEAIFKWAGDPEVTRYMIYSTHPNVEYTRNWLESIDNENPDSYDLGIVLKDTGELVGMGGLIYHAEDDSWHIGYNLRRDMWGKGIIPEAMLAIIAEIQKNRKIKSIFGRFAVDNPKSGRVMEKLGMHYLEDSEFTKFDGSASYKAKVYIREFR